MLSYEVSLRLAMIVIAHSRASVNSRNAFGSVPRTTEQEVHSLAGGDVNLKSSVVSERFDHQGVMSRIEFQAGI